MRIMENSAIVLLVWIGILVSSTSFGRGADALQGVDVQVHHIKPNDHLFDIDDETFHIFCRKGDPKKLINYFKSATLRIVSAADDIKIVKGHDANTVYTKYIETTKWALWAQNLLPWRVREASYPTFNASCVGVGTAKPYTAMLIVRRLDTWNMLILLTGLCLFFFAPKLSRSATFFYGSATALGALGAALVLMFILYRVLPKGKPVYFTLTTLWFFSLYLAGETWNRFGEIVQEKLPYIIVYLTTGAAFAFFTCYRLGPPTHPRTLDIITWALQGGSLILIHLSSDLVEVSTGIIIIVLIYNSCASRFAMGLQRWWRKKFPPKPKLLTEEEYIAQGAVETAKGLEELRKFCSSPDCDSWKLVSRLQNPRRFSSFMSGDSHLSDAEMMDYETETEEAEPEGSSYNINGVRGSNGNLPVTDDESDSD